MPEEAPVIKAILPSSVVTQTSPAYHSCLEESELYFDFREHTMKRQTLHGLGILLISLCAGGMAPSRLKGQVPVVPKSEAQFDVVVEKDVAVPVRDGTKLALDLYRPAREGKPIDGKLSVL